MLQLKDEEIKNLVELTKNGLGKEQYNYKEIQIHGDVLFKRDVKYIYMDKYTNKKHIEIIKKFCDKNKIEFLRFKLNKKQFVRFKLFYEQ